MDKIIHVYTDGAVSNNGYANAIGGWAYILVENEIIIEQNQGKVIGATNQTMEMMGVIKACTSILDNYSILEHAEAIKNSFVLMTHMYTILPSGLRIKIYSDSAYVINCYTNKWWINWEKNGWLNSKKEPVANRPYWEELIKYFKMENFEFIKVKGHANDKFNNIVDGLAVAARLKED